MQDPSPPPPPSFIFVLASSEEELVNKIGGQLDYFIGRFDQFGSRSRIAVTTRDKRVVETFRVEQIYTVNGSDFHEAFEQFL